MAVLSNKAIKENFIWGGGKWNFENDNVSRTYLGKESEMIVKRCPIRKSNGN